MAVMQLAVPATTEGDVEERVESQYRGNGRILVGLAIGLGLTQDEAADVVQEAHVRLLRALRQGSNIADVPAWVATVVYRLAMDQHRLRRRVMRVPGRLSVPAVEGESAADVLDVWKLVDQLPERERAALYLRYQGDLSFEQIGQVLGVGESTARSYASRALGRIRRSTPKADWND